MSPASSREINGPRPAPLKIHKDSHQIQKQSANAGGQHHNHQPQRHQPVIIYTHSPKVIHTQARDFMALVQKLTGHHPDPADDADEKKPEEKPVLPQDQPPHHGPGPSTGGAAAADPATLGFEVPSSGGGIFSDLPIFTPSSAGGGDPFYSPSSMYRFHHDF